MNNIEIVEYCLKKKCKDNEDYFYKNCYLLDSGVNDLLSCRKTKKNKKKIYRWCMNRKCKHRDYYGLQYCSEYDETSDIIKCNKFYCYNMELVYV